MKIETCCREGCDHRVYVRRRGLCRAHYNKLMHRHWTGEPRGVRYRAPTPSEKQLLRSARNALVGAFMAGDNAAEGAALQILRTTLLAMSIKQEKTDAGTSSFHSEKPTEEREDSGAEGAGPAVARPADQLGAADASV